MQFDEKHTTAGNIIEHDHHHHQDCLIFNRCSLHKRNVIYIYIFIRNEDDGPYVNDNT